MPADGKVVIGDRMPPESDPNLTIGDPIPSLPSNRIVIGCHRWPSVPGLNKVHNSVNVPYPVHSMSCQSYEVLQHYFQLLISFIRVTSKHFISWNILLYFYETFDLLKNTAIFFMKLSISWKMIHPLATEPVTFGSKQWLPTFNIAVKS